jgi:hypothetical protein
MIWIAVLGSLRLRPGFTMRRLGIAMAGGLCLLLLTFLLVAGQREFRTSLHESDPHALLASQLAAYGVRRGDRVARIGGLYAASWARLLGVTVVAEIPETDAGMFWSGGESEQEASIQCFRQLGVRAIVAERVTPEVGVRIGNGWLQGGSDRFAVLLTK